MYIKKIVSDTDANNKINTWSVSLKKLFRKKMHFYILLTKNLQNNL